MPSLSTLAPAFRPLAEAILAYARKLDPRFVVTSALRTRVEQQRLYNQYLKGLGTLPVAVPGTSYHELGLAIDMQRLGRPALQDELLASIGREWQKMGGVWGGPRDPVHFQAATKTIPKKSRRRKKRKKARRASTRASSRRAPRRRTGRRKRKTARA